jgi:hypothetical protein
MKAKLILTVAAAALLPISGQATDIWDALDHTLDAVGRHNQQTSEAIRGERNVPPPERGLSASERAANQAYFLQKHMQREKQLAAEYQKQQMLLNNLVKLHQKHPSPGLQQSIIQNSKKLKNTRDECAKSSAYIKRHKH